jgi:hypothetical protein
MVAQLILNILLDGVMALLLVVTTFYCWKLNKRIRVLQDSKSELAQIIQQFDESTQRATQSIGEIHSATTRIAENIQHKIDKANYLADDLQFMIEKGNKLADKMEGGFSSNRGVRASAAPSASPKTQIEDESPPRPAMRKPEAKQSPVRVEARAERAEPSQASGSGGDKARASLESMLKRVSGRGEKANETAQETPDQQRRRVPGARLRSRAEQELFDALKAGGDKA